MGVYMYSVSPEPDRSGYAPRTDISLGAVVVPVIPFMQGKLADAIFPVRVLIADLTFFLKGAALVVPGKVRLATSGVAGLRVVLCYCCTSTSTSITFARPCAWNQTSVILSVSTGKATPSASAPARTWKSAPRPWDAGEGQWASGDWQPRWVTFTASEATRIVEVWVRRNETSALDNKIAGTVWPDNVKLVSADGREVAD